MPQRHHRCEERSDTAPNDPIDMDARLGQNLDNSKCGGADDTAGADHKRDSRPGGNQ